MAFLQWCITNPVKVAVGVLLMLLFGLVAGLRMPIQLTPEVSSPVISVETRWPGASPQEIEREITQAQEEQLKGVPGVVEMTSESQDSEASIRLEFAVGTNIPEALLKVNSVLQQVREYPEDADQPVIRTRDISQRSIGIFVVRPRVVDAEEISAFQREHPQLAPLLEPAKRAYHTGLRVERLWEVARDHPEAAELVPEELEIDTLRRFVENVVEARFERVDGVSDARVLGGRREELQVIVDPHQLAARELTIMDVRRALEAQNVDTSGGDFWESKRRYVVRTLGQFRDPQQVADVILARRDGVPVYVRDVAEVRLGFQKPDGLSLRIGCDALVVLCSRETDANVLDVMAGLRAAVKELNAGALTRDGLQIEQVYDETDYIYSAIGLVRQNIFVGGALTVAVLLLFLRSARSTVIVGLAIPSSLVGTVLILHLLGRSLNVISLAGLAFAVGMLVDNAVVILENIYRHYQRGDAPFEAAARGAHEVWGAVVASTLTTLAVFLPVLFVQEEAGQLFRDIALAISSAVGLSLVISVAVIPTAASRLLRNRKRPGQLDGHGFGADGAGPFTRRVNGHSIVVSAENGTKSVENSPNGPSHLPLLRGLDRFGARFVDFVVALNARVQRHVTLKCLTVAVFVLGAVGLSWWLMPKVEYLPSGNRNLVYANLSLPPGYNLDQFEKIGGQIREGLRPYWDLDLEPATVAALPYPPIADFFYIARGREIFMGVRAQDPLRAGELVPLMRDLTRQIPGGRGGSSQSSIFSRGRGTGRSIEIEFAGPDLERLVGLAGSAMKEIQSRNPEGQVRAAPSLDLSSPELHIVPKKEQAAEVGLSAAELGYTVDALVDGARAGDYFLGADKIDVRIVGKDRYVERTQDLEDLAIATPTGGIVPLGTLADLRLSSGPEQINHRERQRAIAVEFAPADEMPLGAAIEQVEREILEPMRASGDLSGEYHAHLAGTANKLTQAWQALRWNVVLAVVITYLLLAALFESWLYPCIIILSVPLGAVGGILGLQCLNVYLGLTGKSPQHLDVLTMLGFVILIGTVVNNAILIVHRSLQSIRQGTETERAVLDSVRSRIRPIFMTTCTTVFGLLPLVLFPGAGSELYRGLGSVVLGGLAVSTLFTLLLVPTLFTLLLDVFRWRDGNAPWSASKGSQEPQVFVSRIKVSADP